MLHPLLPALLAPAIERGRPPGQGRSRPEEETRKKSEQRQPAHHVRFSCSASLSPRFPAVRAVRLRGVRALCGTQAVWGM
jgi:hypothetical protein